MKERIEQIVDVLDRAAGSTITVFGDFCLDKYLYTDPARDAPSVETRLTAYQIHKKRLYPGAGGTVANNLRALGARVRCVGLLGDDGEGYDLLQELRRIGADTTWMVQSKYFQTCTYTKPMRKGGDGLYTEMNRLDIRNFSPTPPGLEDALLEKLEKALDGSQGVVIIDQFVERNLAAVTDRVRDALAGLAAKYSDKFFYADSRGFADLYRGVIIKCNQHELVGAVGGADLEPTEENVKRCGEELHRRNGKAVVVTMGERGATVFEEGGVAHVPAFPVTGPIDIVGAGDATSAGSILGLTLGLDLPAAALLGGAISSITIQQLGVTGTATVEQVKRRLLSACSVTIQEAGS